MQLQQHHSDPARRAALTAAYRHCQQCAQRHYENFPVASWLLPARLRRPIAVVYTFARGADDAADEGGRRAERHAALDRYQLLLDQIAANTPPLDDPLALALADVIAHHQLPLSLFYDLLSAFRQDIEASPLPDSSALLDYCRRSANPIGRLLLHLDGSATAANLSASDAICSALQRLNFLQDLQQDLEENRRIYLPQDRMAHYGVHADALLTGHREPGLAPLLDEQCQEIAAQLQQGLPLCQRLRGRFGWEIRTITAAALTLLPRLQQRTDPFARPRLRRRDYLVIAARALQLRFKRAV